MVTTTGSVTINVLDNDSDSDGTLIPNTVAVLAQPSQGSVTANGDGTLTYAHTGTVSGNDSFTYTVNDDDGETSNAATVNLSIEAPPPNSGNGPFIDIWYGSDQSFGAIGQPQTWINILGNVSDDDDDISSLTYSLNGDPEKPPFAWLRPSSFVFCW